MRRLAMITLVAVLLAWLPRCARDGVTVLPDAAFDDSGADVHATRPDVWPAGDAKLWDGQPESCGPLDRPCFIGTTFADCGPVAAQGPLLYCGVTAKGWDSCRWVSDGCPTTAYPWPFDGCQSILLGPAYSGHPAVFFMMFGEEPWTRDRAAAIEPSIADAPPPDPSVVPLLRCENTTGEGWIPGIENPCAPGGQIYMATHDTTAFHFFNASLGSGWGLMVEVDTGRQPAIARICRTYGTDFITCGGHPPPLCAMSGVIQLVRHENTLHLVSFRAEFPDGAVVFSEAD